MKLAATRSHAESLISGILKTFHLCEKNLGYVKMTKNAPCNNSIPIRETWSQFLAQIKGLCISLQDMSIS